MARPRAAARPRRRAGFAARRTRRALPSLRAWRRGAAYGSPSAGARRDTPRRTSRMARGGPSSWTRAALVEVMAPIGVAVTAGAAVVATLPPHWRARGAPWVLGYGKNVELVAVACAFGAGAASRWLVTARSGRWAVGAVATIGFAVAVRHADLPALYASWPQLGLVVALVSALRIF